MNVQGVRVRSLSRGPRVTRAVAEDPEAKYRTYGRDFGQKPQPMTNLPSWMQQAPQVRPRGRFVSALSPARRDLAVCSAARAQQQAV